MSYYKDLSEYMYISNKEKNTMNVGWLDVEHEYLKGDVTEEFIIALWEYIKYPVHRTRGLHSNIDLDGGVKYFIAKYQGYNILLGSAEIRVVDTKNNIVYAAPNLILHYVINHQYLPPQSFINAVINGPKPNSDEYGNVIKQIYLDESDMGWWNKQCRYCGSHKLYYAFGVQKEYDASSKIEIVNYEADKYRELQQNESVNNVICKECGKLFKLADED